MALNNLFPNFNPAMRQKSQGEYSAGFLKGTVDATYGDLDYTTLWKHGVQKAEDVVFEDLIINEIELNFLDGYYDAVTTIFKDLNDVESLDKVASAVTDGENSVIKPVSAE